jgi:hypothetical protein
MAAMLTAPPCAITRFQPSTGGGMIHANGLGKFAPEALTW